MNTLFDKIWDAHLVTKVEDGHTQLYIDRLFCHEVTSPQAFSGLRARGIKVMRPEKVFVCLIIILLLMTKISRLKILFQELRSIH
jgi:homoaconitase/3-isopropylmalate dehydratase large subunit